MPESPPVISATLSCSLPEALYAWARYCGRGSILLSRPGFCWCCSGKGGFGRATETAALFLLGMLSPTLVRSVLGVFDFGGRQIAKRRPVQDLALGVKARAMAGAVPRSLR